MTKDLIPAWYTKRHYLHFDEPISASKAEKIATDKATVAKHAFFPFISYTFELTKLDRDTSSGKLYQKPKPREVAYSSHIDSHIYAYFASLLSEQYEIKVAELGLQDSVLAFRKLGGKNNIHFANDAFNDIKAMGTCSVIALDFSKFFDTLDHQILKQQWCNLLGFSKLPKDHYNVFRSLTKFSKVDRNPLFELFDISQYTPKSNGRTRVCSPEEFRNEVRGKGLIQPNPYGDKGIPQGSPISALLSNIYMLSFDEQMQNYVNSVNGKYFRYCDDMLFIVPSEHRDIVEKLAKNKVAALKVQINSKKTEIRDFKIHNERLSSFDEHGKQKPLQYLGFLFDGHSIFLRSTALARYSEKMKGGVKLAKKTMEKENRIRKEKGEPEQTQLYKRKLHRLYSYRGKRNFLSYGYRASKIMNSKSIKKQLKPLWKRLKDEIDK
ncbi:antiviral reverse transcriptase Drt2 [Vibrio furnissii]|uniref:antiviral reverse transcriptase Drt2 n=1 Tax=Vibrio furnissii TaxID=29494 RepID=UPI001EECBF8F|nr:antiviral reverse transcriptase Drt2 [Vibrio furnissii]MCG6231525.1 reverse transcriptase/maturase family protein [Vibrio furnissii]MCG6261450.1 reverse transcriptase/maturase family protein [Vibrio furnissii]